MAGYNGSFAACYDRLTPDVNYAAMADFCLSAMQQYHPKCELALDLACGTGSLSAELAHRGIETIGVDASAEMLMTAAEKNAELNTPVLYLCQPMESLDLYGTVDLAVCTLDSINHLSGPDAVECALERLQFFVEPGGLFIFDVNTPYKHRSVLGSSTYVREAEGVFCVWQNEYSASPNDRVEITMDFFLEQGSAYRREQEHFFEYAYGREELSAMLARHHFKALGYFDGYTAAAAGEENERWVCIAKRT